MFKYKETNSNTGRKNGNVKKKVTAGVLAAVLLSMATLPMSTSSYAATDATVQSYEEQLAAIEQKKQDALDALDNIESEKGETWNTMAELDNLINYNSEKKRLAEAQIDTLDQQIAEINANIADRENKLERQEDAFLSRMVENYMDDDTDYIEIILGSKSLLDFLIKFDYVKAVFEYDEYVIKDLEEQRDGLEVDKEKLVDAQDKQKERVADFEKAITDTQSAYDAKLAYIDELQQDEARQMELYNYNLAQESALNAELEEYLAELQRKSQSLYIGGTIGFPLDANASIYVSSEQGWRNLYGVSDYHLGMDLACANGTDVMAANGGTVVKSEFHYSYGNYVLIDHGGGISTLYAHMSDRLVYEGETVSAGQLVGHVGLTGNTFGYHLHFEVRENGQVQNPRNYCEALANY